MTATDFPPVRGYRHEAFLYSGDYEFFEGIIRFIRDGVASGDALLIVVDAPKIDRLRRSLNGEASAVTFADMQDVGHNPALILQAWRDFVAEHAHTGRALRGVGEPVAAARTEAAIVEFHIHELLLNAAFGSTPDFWLLCPYDTAGLSRPEVELAVASHPHVRDGRGPVAPGLTRREALDPLTCELPEPPGYAQTIRFGPDTIHDLRASVGSRARAAGIDDQGVAGLVLAVSEVATNTIVHGRGRGIATVWVAGGSFVCELRGPGRITDPMVGRLRPTRGQMHGYGIWLANQFCDLVQIRSNASGTTVRLHLARDAGRSIAR